MNDKNRPLEHEGNRRGFTLIELLFSLGIFTTLLVFSLFTLEESHRLSELSRGRLQAAGAIRSTLEAIKDTSLDSLGTISLTTFEGTMKNGDITITTDPATILSSTEIATVTVAASWTGPKNRTYNMTVTTLKSAY